MDIWSVAKEFTALVELTMWHTSFPDFSYTSNTKALLGNNSFQIIETGFAEQF
jgi:hypothetical protein